MSDGTAREGGDTPARTQIRDKKNLRLLEALASRDGPLCRWCGTDNDLEISPVDPDGPALLENLQILCGECNTQKGEGRDDKTVRWDSSVWQRGFTIIPNSVLLSPTISPATFRIYSLLVYYAREDDDCWPGQDGLAAAAGVSKPTIRKSVRELEEARLLQTHRRGLGQTNIYVLLAPREEKNRASRRKDFFLQEGKNFSPNKTQYEEDALEEEKTPSKTEAGNAETVRGAWLASAPPLQRHRDAYFESPRFATAVKGAAKVYPVEEIAKAIANYATVLGSDEYRWSYSWTAHDFLKRGLDRFVDEAEPLRRERIGQPRVSADDFGGLDDI